MHCLLPGSGKSLSIQCETRKDNICLERGRTEAAWLTRSGVGPRKLTFNSLSVKVTIAPVVLKDNSETSAVERTFCSGYIITNSIDFKVLGEILSL